MSQFDEQQIITEQIKALNDRNWATRKQAVMPLITAIRENFPTRE